MIYVCAPQFQREELTAEIGYEIAQKAGVEFTTEEIDEGFFVLELGGIEDKLLNGVITDIMIQDKTKSKVFTQVLSRSLKVARCDFQTALSGNFGERYVRIEMTNKVRYSKEYRELLVNCCVEILKQIKKLVR